MEAQCNLIVDSCCDLPYAAVNRPGVFLLPFPYMVQGTEHSDDFYQSTTAHDFYDAMRSKNAVLPSTSQIPSTDLHAVFSEAIATGLPSVYLSFSSGLSGSYDMACMVRDKLLEDHEGAEVFIVDTKLASIAEGLLVLGAIEQREAGLSATELVAWAEEARWYVNAQFMVDSLDALQAGGRIPASMAMAGSKLDVKPLMGFDLAGRLSLVGVSRGRKKGMRSLVDYFNKRNDTNAPSQRVVIGNADCEHDAERLRDAIAKDTSNALFLHTSIGPVIGSHVGPDMLACVFWGPDRRDEVGVAERIARRVKERDQ